MAVGSGEVSEFAAENKIFCFTSRSDVPDALKQSDFMEEPNCTDTELSGVVSEVWLRVTFLILLVESSCL
jgi:hypothetical protein